MLFWSVNEMIELVLYTYIHIFLILHTPNAYPREYAYARLNNTYVRTHTQKHLCVCVCVCVCVDVSPKLIVRSLYRMFQ